MFRLLVRVLACALVAAPAEAQPKPVGAFSPDGSSPDWVTFGSIQASETDATLTAAAKRSRATGFQWILHLGYDVAPHVPAGPVAAASRARLERLGLWPHIAAVNYGEEYYEALWSGSYANYGLSTATDAGAWAAVRVVRDWMAIQQTAVAVVTGKPVIWITTLVNNETRWGPWYYRPVPAGAGMVAVDAYQLPWQDFDRDVLPILLHAETQTALPLVVIPQWFSGQGWARPTRLATERYAEILRRPRWVAMWGFLWASRPWSGLVGLDALPDVLAEVWSSLGGSGDRLHSVMRQNASHAAIARTLGGRRR